MAHGRSYRLEKRGGYGANHLATPARERKQEGAPPIISLPSTQQTSAKVTELQPLVSETYSAHYLGTC